MALFAEIVISSKKFTSDYLYGVSASSLRYIDTDQDDRPQQKGDGEPAWEELLPRLVKVQKILMSSDSAVKASNFAP